MPLADPSRLTLDLQEALDALKRLQINDGLVFPFERVVFPVHQADVDAVRQELMHGRFRPRLSSTSLYAELKHAPCCRIQTERAFCVFCEDGLRNLRIFGVGDDIADAAVIHVAERFRRPRPLATAKFFLHAPLYVLCEADDVISRPSALDAHEEASIIREELARWCPNGSDDAFLEKPPDTAFVDGVAIETVNIPAEESICFTAFNPFEHPVEKGTAWMFGRLALHDGFMDQDAFALCEGAKLRELRVQAHHLTLFLVRALAGVEEKFNV